MYLMAGNERFSIDQPSQYGMFLSLYEGEWCQGILGSVAIPAEMQFKLNYLSLHKIRQNKWID
jgi:hypothetical protein